MRPFGWLLLIAGLFGLGYVARYAQDVFLLEREIHSARQAGLSWNEAVEYVQRKPW